MAVYNVCSNCACGLEYDEWSHIEDEEQYASISATVEAIGRVTHTHVRDIGCFTCYMCDEVAYENARVFEGADLP